MLLKLVPEARLDLMELEEQAKLTGKAWSGSLDASESVRLRRLDERWGRYEGSDSRYGALSALAVVFLIVLGGLSA